MFEFGTTRASLRQLATDRSLTASTKLVTGTPGVKSVLGGSDSGAKYLMHALSKVDSALCMPKVDSEQQLWKNWFSKLHEIRQHYDISEGKLIHTVTGHLPTTHTVMFGWQEITDTLRATGDAPTLTQFEEHVTQQLFVRTETRSGAYKELMLLSRNVLAIADCHTLITKLKQVFLQLYPTVTDEREPVSRYEACLAVHKVVTQLHGIAPHRSSTALTHAMSQYQFNHTDLYFDHLEHPPTSEFDSKQNCAAYLEALYSHLQKVQRMHNRVHGETLTVGQPQHDVVAAAAQHFQVTPDELEEMVHYNNNESSAGDSGKRNSAEPRNRAFKRGKRMETSQGGASSSAGGKVAASEEDAKAHGARLEAVGRNRPQGHTLSDLAQAGGVTRSLDACIALQKDRKCVFCTKVHGNFVTCNTLSSAQKDAVGKIAERRKKS